MRKDLTLITKYTSRFALLFSLVTLCTLLTVFSRGVDWIREWNGASVFYPDSGPFWLISIFTELVIIGVLIPAVAVSDSMSRPTSFFWGRPVSPLNVLWVKLLLIAAVGALVPAIFEAGFWLARGFNVGVAIDCAVELFATRLIVIAPFVGVACCSPTFGDYVMALLRLFGLILLVTFILGVLLIPLAAVITIISGVHLWSTLDRVSELSDALTYGLSWAGVLWLGRSQLPRLGATTVAAVCATPISALLLLSLVSGTVTPLPTEAKQQEIPQELSLHGEENTLIAAKQQSGIDSVYTDVRFSSPVSPRFAPDTVRCLSTDTVRAAVEREGVRVRAIGWLPNCFAFGKS